jgi:putative tricarboxylic transport membrane protein
MEDVVRKANMVCAVIGMLFSTVVFIITLGFKKFKNVPVGPEFFPRYLAIGLFICSAVLLIQAIGKERPSPSAEFHDKGMRRLLVGFGIIVVYALCWEPVGFIIVTPLAMFALMFLLGLRRYGVMILFSCVAMIAIFSAFRFLLGIDMHLGVLEGLL